VQVGPQLRMQQEGVASCRKRMA